MGLLGLVCLGTGPLLGIAAVALGGTARKQIATVRRSGGEMDGVAMANTGILTGALSVACFSATIAVLLGIRTPRGASGHDHIEADRSHAAPQPPEVSPPAPSASTAPTMSTMTIVGNIAIVDIAAGVPSLSKELADQRTAAASHGERILVEIVTGSCAPCEGIATALGDARMQKALAHVRLLRIDRDQFEEDLDELEIPSKPWPSFFLLDADLRVRDAIDGEEWDEDVAANIAPVLGPFVRGTYTKRRTPWHPARPSGTLL